MIDSKDNNFSKIEKKESYRNRNRNIKSINNIRYKNIHTIKGINKIKNNKYIKEMTTKNSFIHFTQNNNKNNGKLIQKQINTENNIRNEENAKFKTKNIFPKNYKKILKKTSTLKNNKKITKRFAMSPVCFKSLNSSPYFSGKYKSIINKQKNKIDYIKTAQNKKNQSKFKKYINNYDNNLDSQRKIVRKILTDSNYLSELDTNSSQNNKTTIKNLNQKSKEKKDDNKIKFIKNNFKKREKNNCYSNILNNNKTNKNYLDNLKKNRIIKKIKDKNPNNSKNEFKNKEKFINRLNKSSNII